MDRSNRWRAKALLYRDLGMSHDDPALREALFIAAEIYSSEAERVSCCGTVAEPSSFVALAAMPASGARCAAEALQEICDESDEDQGAEEDAPLLSDRCREDGLEAAWNRDEGRDAVMDAGFVRQQAAKYRKRAGEIADPVASLALRSLALTCEELARDLEAREARRGRVFRARKPH